MRVQASSWPATWVGSWRRSCVLTHRHLVRPCVDLDYGVSEIIGDRSFHACADVVGQLAVAYMRGMREAGWPRPPSTSRRMAPWSPIPPEPPG